MKIKEIKLVEDLREENILQRDVFGKPIKFRQSQFVCKIIFDNDSFCVMEFKDLSRALDLISENEDFKYPIKEGKLGRKMNFYAYIYPMFKKVLSENGFVPNLDDLKESLYWKDKKKS